MDHKTNKKNQNERKGNKVKGSVKRYSFTFLGYHIIQVIH